MEAKLPLEGVRVVDLTVMLQGPLASAILADLGAEVIKVERPGIGEPVRKTRIILHKPNVLPNGINHMFEIGHRNKKAIALDLHHPDGQEAFYRLIEKSDVLVTNLLQEGLRDLGADHDTVRKRNPGLVYVHGTGYGTRGPCADDHCTDLPGTARSGFLFNDSPRDGDPLWLNGGLSDITTGTMMAFGAVTGLFAKMNTGQAPIVNASQISSMMWLGQLSIGLYSNLGEEFSPFERANGYSPLMNLYRCADGKWLALGMAGDRGYWHGFCEATGLLDLEDDPRFHCDAERMENNRELISLLDDVFGTKPRDEWVCRLREKKLIFSIVNRYSDLPNDPQIQANEYIVTRDNGVKGVAVPFEFEGLRFRRQGAPQFGQHTQEILEGVCGYSEHELARLKEQGIIE